MSIHSIQMYSNILQKHSRFQVLINDLAKPPYPALYLLHGLGGDESTWLRKTDLETQCKQYPFLITMPDSGRSFYCDSPMGNYETYLIKELIPHIDRVFSTRNQRKYRAICGASMGGFGAVKIALKHPELFYAATGHHSSFQYGLEPAAMYPDKPELMVLENSIDVETNNVFTLAKNCNNKKRPKMYFDCGHDDFLLKINDQFHRHLKKIKYPHTYKKYPGTHNWEYPKAHITDSLDFLCEVMRLKKTSS